MSTVVMLTVIDEGQLELHVGPELRVRCSQALSSGIVSVNARVFVFVSPITILLHVWRDRLSSSRGQNSTSALYCLLMIMLSRFSHQVC